MDVEDLEVDLVDEATVVRAARLRGPQSGPQLALDDAAERRARGETVVFVIRGDTLYVAEASTVVSIQ